MKKWTKKTRNDIIPNLFKNKKIVLVHPGDVFYLGDRLTKFLHTRFEKHICVVSTRNFALLGQALCKSYIGVVGSRETSKQPKHCKIFLVIPTRVRATVLRILVHDYGQISADVKSMKSFFVVVSLNMTRDNRPICTCI